MEEVQSIHHSNLKAYIVLGCDADGDNFVAVQFADGEQLAMSQLLYLLVSGQMVEETVKSLRRACSSEEEAKRILQTLTGLMQQHIQQNVMPQRSKNPVVDPTEVFNRREQGDFKG